MKKFLLIFAILFALTARAYGTDIDIGASQITGFNSGNLGADVALSNVSVTLGSTAVTCSNCVPASAVGMSGFRVSLAGVVYEVAGVASRSAFTLAANYAGATGTVSGVWHKFAVLRIYVTRPFTPFGESFVVQSGAPGTTAWYRRYAVSVINDGAQNVAYLPAINDLPATTDSSVPAARYFAAIYTQAGGFMQGFPGCVDDFRLSHETSPTSWAQICEDNLPPASPPLIPTNFYTAREIDSRFPSCSVNQLIYYAATGNVQTCLTLSSDFSITGGVLSSTGAAMQLQEEGANLPIRNTINFVGSGLTAADDAGNRTNITVDSDLNALASNAATGFWAITGAGTGSARTLQGTLNRIVVTNGNGGAGDPVFDVGSSVATSGNNLGFFASTTSAQLAGVISDETGSGALVFGTSPTLATPTITTPTVSGGVFSGGAFSGGTFTSPRIDTSILDTNGGVIINLSPVASAVNQVMIANATAGNPPALSVTGGDTNIDLLLAPKGTGAIKTINHNIEVVRTAGNSGFGYLITNPAAPVSLRMTINDSGTFFLSIPNITDIFTVDLMISRAVTFSQIPILPASNPTTANQAVRKQYVDDSKTAFSVSWYYAAIPGATETNESVGRWIVPVGTEITITDITVVWGAGTDSSASNVFTIKRRNSSGTLQADVGTVDVNTPAQNAVQVTTLGSPLTLTAGDQLYPLLTTRNTGSEQNVTISIRGTQKRTN